MARPKTPLNIRFWKYVHKTSDCWLWTGAQTHGGYGVIQRGGRGDGIVRAHRYSYEERYGSLPSHLDVCHTCDNPRCVNPAHLFAGDAKANVADMVAKGRARGGGPNGEKHPHAKLTAADVVKIRKMYAERAGTLDGLAHVFGVSQKTIFNVVHRRIWREV